MRNFNFRLAVVVIVLLSVWTSAFAQNKGFDTSRMDKSVEACTDFFQYANGTWLKNTEIPAAYSRWGSFNILGENNNAVLKSVLETASKTKAASGTDTQLIGDYFASCMDEAAIEKAGVKPLKSYFTQIEQIKTTADLQRQIAMMHNMGVPVLFGFGGATDLKNSTMVIASAIQGGLSLPNRDYYTKDDAKSKEVREKFLEYSKNMFKLLGDTEAEATANAKTVMDLQMRLANSSKAPVELRDPNSRYNKMTIAQAAEIAPNLAWTEYMSARGVPPVQELNVGQPAFFKEVSAMMKEVSLDDWKTYLRWMLINSAAPRLSKSFVNENFNFYSKYLQGAKEMQPRWRQCVGATDGAIGEALGQEFVKTAFTPEAKARMDKLIDNLFVAFRSRLSGLEWMSDETKKQGLEKLSTFKRKIGYPDTLRGYKGLTIDRKSYLMNALRSGQFEIARNLKDIGKPVDRTRWGMTPPTVNAYYSSGLNEIVFPAGILQPPFFNFAADDAINYGSIGGVIGHEITHGFDDQGSKFDAFGNFKSWWTESDRAKFEERASCVANQFNTYEVQKGLNINGRLTLGENIADLGGLTVAYDAYLKSLEGKPRPANIDGFTPEQRFFLGWAQVWAGKYTSEAERTQVLGDTHSLPRWRVNGPLSNMPQFSKAFGCKQPDAMVREDVCLIW
ncbi:MAG: M13 family metallopeptidase [Acidobacteriota bacterium]|nr:M13 family metallopeptidase [Acidobacteriota bacterium]